MPTKNGVRLGVQYDDQTVVIDLAPDRPEEQLENWVIRFQAPEDDDVCDWCGQPIKYP